MSESADRIPAGDERAGQACGFCAQPLEAADAAAICAECRSLHHEACWDRALGCSKSDCFNAPLTRLDAPDVAEPVAPAQASDHAAPADAPRRRRRRTRAAEPGMGSPRVRRIDGARPCVDCGISLFGADPICPGCHAINTPDGLYHGPKTTFKGARDALIMAIVGMFFCGPILGPLAISRASIATKTIKNDPRLGGEGLAAAATVIGALDIVFWLFALLSRMGGGR